MSTTGRSRAKKTTGSLRKNSLKSSIKKAEPARTQSSPFSTDCYEVLSQVPRGKVTTYQLIAQALGSRAVRAVGTAMAKNPFAPRIPCHRVVRSDGHVGQYAGGSAKKQRMLLKEGIRIRNGRVEDLSRFLFAPKARSKKASAGR